MRKVGDRLTCRSRMQSEFNTVPSAFNENR